MTLDDTPITVRVMGCARCEGGHDELEFVPMTNPPDEISHWAMCPTTDEPILLKFTEAPEGFDDEPNSNQG